MQEESVQMDGENLTGSPSEFLEMTGKIAGENASDVPEPEDVSLSTAADSESADEEESDDLSPEERVAAVLGEGEDDDGVAEPDVEDEDEDPEGLRPAAADPSDLDALTPEQMRELAEEALRIRAEAPHQEAARIYHDVEEAAGAAVQLARQQIDAAWRRDVITVSEAHYGNLIEQAVAENDSQRVRTVLRAQRAWEAEKRAEWDPYVSEALEQAATQARRAHPGGRRLWAQHLADERGLPARAVEEILKEPDTTRFVKEADHLARMRDLQIAERRRGNQKVREEAAKRVSATRITSPATGRPKPAKIVPLRGTADEWIAARKQGAI